MTLPPTPAPLAPLAPAVMTREDARAAGLRFYSTGKPCKRGHAPLRYSANGRCCECSRAERAAAKREGRAIGALAASDRARHASGEIGERVRRLAAGPQCPIWVRSDPELIRQMREVYARSYQMGAEWNVDHVVALKGKNARGEHVVSGLHVPWNLQVVPAAWNIQKGARFDALAFDPVTGEPVASSASVDSEIDSESLLNFA